MDTDRWHLVIDTESCQRTSGHMCFCQGQNPRSPHLPSQPTPHHCPASDNHACLCGWSPLEVPKQGVWFQGQSLNVCVYLSTEARRRGKETCVFMLCTAEIRARAGRVRPRRKAVERTAGRTAQVSRPGRGHSSRASGTSAVPEILVARYDQLRAKQNQNNTKR